MLFNMDLATSEFGLESVTCKAEKHIKYHFQGQDYSAQRVLVICGPMLLAAAFRG